MCFYWKKNYVIFLIIQGHRQNQGQGQFQGQKCQKYDFSQIQL